MSNPESIFQWKEVRVSGAALTTSSLGGKEMSLWQWEGTPSHGAVPPTTAANPDNTTAGSLMQGDPAAGKQKWLASIDSPGPPAGGAIALWDRLVHCSGFSGTVTTAQNLNGGSPATVSRTYVDNQGNQHVGNRIFVEIYTAVGATGTTITASYTNQAGTAGQTTQAVTFGNTGFKEQCRWIELPLAAGDTGVQAVTSVTVLATTGTAGNFGVVVAHPILHMPNAAQPDGWCGAIDGFIEILTGACLFWTWQIQVAAVATQPGLPFVNLAFVDR